MDTTNNDIKDFLLSPIVAPSLNQSDYAAGIKEVLDKIDDNFAKLTSVPFLRGADGKDFHLVKQSFFVSSDSDNINDWYKSILYSIYKQDDDSFNIELFSILNQSTTIDAFHKSLYNNDGTTETGLLVDYSYLKYYPIHDGTKYVFADDSISSAPYIWLYRTVGDAGEIISQFPAQYYRFIDDRLAVFNSDQTVDYTNIYFDEMSCFLSYNPSSDELFRNIKAFDRLYLSPTLTYDKTKHDWLWVINGEVTGISAQGARGYRGEDGSKCWYGIVNENPEISSEDTRAVVNINHAVYDIKYLLLVVNGEFEWVDITDSSNNSYLDNVKDGDLIFCLIPEAPSASEESESENPSDILYSDMFMSVVKKIGSKTNGFEIKVRYDGQYSFAKYFSSIELPYLLRQIGKVSTNLPENRGLWIPQDPTRIGTSYQYDLPVHMMYSSDGDMACGDKNLVISVSKFNGESANPQQSDVQSVVDQVTRLILNGYVFHASKILLQDNPINQNNNAVKDALSGVLNVYGDSYFSGSIQASAKSSNDTLSILDYANISINGDKYTNTTDSYTISTQNYAVYYKGSPILRSNVVSESVWSTSLSGSVGTYHTVNHNGINIPYLSSTYSDFNKTSINSSTTNRRAMFGDFCMIDSSANSDADVMDCFEELLKGQYSNISLVPINRTITMSSIDHSNDAHIYNASNSGLKIKCNNISNIYWSLDNPSDVVQIFSTQVPIDYIYTSTVQSRWDEYAVADTALLKQIGSDQSYEADYYVTTNRFLNGSQLLTGVGAESYDNDIKSLIINNVMPSYSGKELKTIYGTLSYNFTVCPTQTESEIGENLTTGLYRLIGHAGRGSGGSGVGSIVGRACRSKEDISMQLDDAPSVTVTGQDDDGWLNMTTYYPITSSEVSGTTVQEELAKYKQNYTFTVKFTIDCDNNILTIMDASTETIYGSININVNDICKNKMWYGIRDHYYAYTEISGTLNKFSTKFTLDSIQARISTAEFGRSSSQSSAYKYLICPMGVYRGTKNGDTISYEPVSWGGSNNA